MQILYHFTHRNVNVKNEKNFMILFSISVNNVQLFMPEILSSYFY